MIRLVKSEKVDTVLEESRDKKVGYGLEKTFHLDMLLCIKEVLDKFKDVFPNLPLGLLPVQKGHEFCIDLQDTTSLLHKPIYKLSPLDLKEMKKQIDYMLEHEYIRPSDFPYGS